VTTPSRHWESLPIWCFEIGKESADDDYEHLTRHPEPEPEWLIPLRDHLWDLFSRIKDSVLASGQPGLVYVPLPAGLASGVRSVLARIELVETPEVAFLRMLCLVLEVEQLTAAGCTPVPADTDFWLQIANERPVAIDSPASLREPGDAGEIRVCGLAESLLARPRSPRVIEGLTPAAAIGAMRAALQELPVDRRLRVSFALNLVPEEPLLRRLAVVFPPLPLALPEPVAEIRPAEGQAAQLPLLRRLASRWLPS
jgi:hypothetical protein